MLKNIVNWFYEICWISVGSRTWKHNGGKDLLQICLKNLSGTLGFRPMRVLRRAGEHPEGMKTCQQRRTITIQTTRFAKLNRSHAVFPLVSSPATALPGRYAGPFFCNVWPKITWSAAIGICNTYIVWQLTSKSKLPMTFRKPEQHELYIYRTPRSKRSAISQASSWSVAFFAEGVAESLRDSAEAAEPEPATRCWPSWQSATAASANLLFQGFFHSWNNRIWNSWLGIKWSPFKVYRDHTHL